jgi:hypothetical protein
LGKNFNNSWKIGPNFFLRHIKNKTIFSFVKFVATKNGLTKKIFHPCLLLLFLDPGSEIRDPVWVKINPGSATLQKSLDFQGLPLPMALEVDLPASKSLRPAPYKKQVH